MRNTFTPKQTGLAVLCALALGLLSAAASAQAPNEKGLLTDTRGGPVPLYEKVSLDANVLFDSGKSALRPAGRDALDGFVGRMQGLDTQSVMVAGYADRMGSESHNQILSEERADAVKAYLVTKGIAADRVRTSGWGETRPDTLRAACKDANNAKNVACMQADRHVFIEVAGTRIAK